MATKAKETSKAAKPKKAKATAKQKKGLAEGHKLMAEAVAWQKEGGFITVKKYKRNIKDYLKKHAGK